MTHQYSYKKTPDYHFHPLSMVNKSLSPMDTGPLKSVL